MAQQPLLVAGEIEQLVIPLVREDVVGFDLLLFVRRCHRALQVAIGDAPRDVVPDRIGRLCPRGVAAASTP